MCRSPSSFSHNFIPYTTKLNFFTAVNSKFCESLVHWEKIFFSPLGFDIQRDFDLETSKITLHSIRAPKRYQNEIIWSMIMTQQEFENLVHTISARTLVTVAQVRLKLN